MSFSLQILYHSVSENFLLGVHVDAAVCFIQFMVVIAMLYFD